jgi:hypothetical protein
MIDRGPADASMAGNEQRTAANIKERKRTDETICENTNALIGNHRFKANASKNKIDLIVESRKIRNRLETSF